MEEEIAKGIMDGSSTILGFASLAVLYLIIEALKSWGFQKRRTKENDKNGCLWTGDDHRWLMDLRDTTRDLKFMQSESGRDVGEISDSLQKLSENLFINIKSIEILARDIRDLSKRIKINGNGKEK